MGQGVCRNVPKMIDSLICRIKNIDTPIDLLENVMTSAPPTSPAPVPSASGTPSTDSKATTDKSAPASASTPATDNNVSEKPTADQAHPTIISSNPQKERDLFTVTTGNCFKQFEVHWIFALNVTDHRCTCLCRLVPCLISLRTFY